ncbi:MAG: TetR family transcriptional regulator, partial [Solirubrobacteraceae bacterium]
MNGRSPIIPTSRAQRKRNTRRALLNAALDLLEDEGFASLSMSRVARRAGIVPSAFYRHFAGMEALGVALIDESFGTLRTMLSAARSDPRTYEHVVGRSVEILASYVREHRAHFRFIGRERS